MIKYEIGAVIFWNIGIDVICKGVVLEDTSEGFLEVILHTINDRTYNKKLTVLKSLVRSKKTL